MPKGIDQRRKVLGEMRAQYELLIPPGTGEEHGSDHVHVINPPAIKRFAKLQGEFLAVNAYQSPSQRRRVFANIWGEVTGEATRRGWSLAKTPGWKRMRDLMLKLEDLIAK